MTKQNLPGQKGAASAELVTGPRAKENNVAFTVNIILMYKTIYKNE